jgi:hypothetical protein
MDITMRQSILLSSGSKGRNFDMTLEATTAVENDPPMFRLTINGQLMELPLVIVDEVIKMLTTAKSAIKDHNIGPLY